jgi:formylglycine-generating enzyme required for sulfatase activity
VITDASIDDREVSGTTILRTMGGFVTRVPSEAALDRAVLAYDEPTPAMLESHARWLDLIAELEPALTPLEILQLAARAWEGAYIDGLQLAPSDEVLDPFIAGHHDAVRPWLEEMREAAVAGKLPPTMLPLAATAASHLEGPTPLRIVTAYARPRPMRVLVERAKPAERARWLHEFLDIASTVKRSGKREAGEFVATRVRRVLPVVDLCGDGRSRAVLREACELAKKQPALADEVALRLERGPAKPPARPTETARETRAYLDARYGATRRSLALPAVAAKCASRAVDVDDAGELIDGARWLAASAKRRRAIAERVARALGEDFTLEALEARKQRYASLLHAASGVRFVLVPGGTFVMGLSPGEEKVLRAAAKAWRGTEGFDEQIGTLVDSLDDMRPAHRVRIAPLLVSEAPLGAPAVAALCAARKRRSRRAVKEAEPVALTSIADVLERSPFRLLSEAEREYVARGTAAPALTPLAARAANRVPDESALVALKEPCGPFGLRELGTLPEVCSDVYVPGYAKAPKDGRPRSGKGALGLPSASRVALVARGGAGWLSPWQGAGEWQLLCNAVRGPLGGWNETAALRLALGVRVR